MRIMMLSPDYFPKLNPRVFRWQALAEHWVGKGWEVHFICASHRDFPALEMLKGVIVHRLGYANLMDWRYHFFGIKNRRDEAKGEQKENEQRGISRGIARIFHLAWRMVYWPDGSCLWIDPAKRKALQLLKEREFDAVVSISLPFSSHWVALKVKKQYPRLKWLADIGDPFALLEEFPKNNLMLYRRQNFRAERKVLRFAAAIVLTNQGALDLYASHFPESASKMTVIPPLFHQPTSSNYLKPVFNPEKINVGYFGAFYSKIRQPEPMLELFSHALSKVPELKSKLALHLFGYIEDRFRKTFNDYLELGKVLCFHGLVKKEEAHLRMQQCDVLVNIGNTTAHQLPSKSVDYLMSGKSLLNICQREDDTFAKYLKDYPLLLNCFFENGKWNAVKVEGLVEFLYNAKGRSVEKEWLERESEKFSLSAVAKRYENLLSQNQTEASRKDKMPDC